MMASEVELASWIEEPTVELRWRRRPGHAGMPILQQAWRLRRAMGDWEWRTEWRDVPVVEGE